MNLVPYGIPANHLVSKLREGAEIIKKLLSGEEVTYNGRFFRLERAFIRPEPSSHIPVWIAGNSPKTMLLTAELGDGWVPTASMGPEGYGKNLRMIREHARRSGRNEEIEAALFGYIVVENSYEEARKRIEIPGRVIALLSPFRRRFLEKVGIDEDELGFPHLMEFAFNQESVSKLLEWSKRIPFEIVEDRYIFGSPDDVIDRLSEFAEAGAQHFVLTPLVQHKHYLDTVRRIAEKVMPYFRDG